LKTGVDKPDLYDPKINRSYAELAAHYGTLVDPARAYKDKPQVEHPMPYVRDSFWRGRAFDSLPRMRAAALVWCVDVAGARACRPLDGAAPAAVFDTMERDALAPLPTAPFVLATWSSARVGPDIHATVAGTLYSVPWRHIGDRLDVRRDAAANQERVLAAAVTVMLREGRTGPMATIAEEAGVEVATLYHRYATREVLLEALTERSFRMVLAVCEEAAARNGPAIAAFDWFFDRSIEHRTELVLPLYGGPPELLPGTRAVRAQVHRAIARLLERGRADGTIALT
jgi:Bacterial regulatory proteins, tetR family